MRKFLVFIILISSLFAKESNSDYEILAKKIDSKNDLIYGTGDVVIFSKENYMSADKAIYDKGNRTLELFGNVIIMRDNSVELISDYAYIDLNKQNSIIDPFLLFDNNKNIWINSKKAIKDDKLITLQDSIISSCECEDPIWSFRFTSGTYNLDDEWINSFNTRLYIKSTPVLYTPYFGFPVNKKRRTGILPATLGYSKTEGFLYAQPIFIAPKENYDIELIPQYRGDRGEGMYAYYRYADSKYSTLKITSGIFNEKQSYIDANGLKNGKHYGYDLEYDRSNLFSNDKENKDSLYTSIHWLNDIDYKNLERDQESTTYNQKIESKINYYFNTPKYYLGTYFRYYVDTTKDSNKDTMQQLPQVHLHSYDKTLFDNLRYSSDIKITNFEREVGLKAYQYDLSLPITYSKSLFDDYINFSFKEILESSYIDYQNEQVNYKNAYLIQNKHVFYLGTDLLKPYENFLHTLNFYTQFSIPNNIKRDGDIYKITNNSTDLEYFPLTEEKKILSFGLNQAFYDRDSLKDIVQHKIKQSIIYDDIGNSKLSDLDNEVIVNYGIFTLSNRSIYNHQDKKQTESSTNFNISYNDFNFNSNYYVSKNTPNSGKTELESYTFSLKYNFYKDYSLSYYENYNVNEKIRSKQAITLGIDDSCWNMNIKLENSIVASSTIDNRAIRQNIIYFNIVLKPFAKIKQNYILNNDKN